MATKHTINTGEWVQVAATATGSLYAHTGKFALAQAAVLPVGGVDTVPLLGSLNAGEDKVYFNIPAGQGVFAYGIKAGAITDSEGA